MTIASISVVAGKMTRKKIQGIIDFVMPGEVKDISEDFTIKFMECGGDDIGGGIISFRNKTITLKINVDDKYPYHEAQDIKEFKENNPGLYRLEMKRFEKITGAKYDKDYIHVLYLSRIEALVFAAAHEFFHLSQAINDEDISNKHADMYALSKLREWRRLHNKPVYQDPLVLPV